MSRAPFLIAALDAAHERSTFNCGSAALNRYLREQVTQDIRRRVASCFVALDSGQRIAGFYTLATASIPLLDLPHDTRRKLPRYPVVPAVRMGRLAVDRMHQRQGLGAALLVNALRRAAHSELAAFAMMVDAKNDEAVAFHRHHGFIALPDSPRMLFLPLAAVR